MKCRILMMIMLLVPVLVLSQSARDKVAEGNKLFTEEKFDEANNK